VTLVIHNGINHNGILQCEPGNLMGSSHCTSEEPTANEKVRVNFESNTFEGSGGTNRVLADPRCPQTCTEM
jgi:hypothetical protein